MPGPTERRHILTVSVEEYFHGGALANVVLRKHWNRFESRIDRSVDEALAVLDRFGAKATFFVLGLLAERDPALVRRIADAGHEVASRGFWPRGVDGMMAEEFAEDLDRTKAALEAAGSNVVVGYRSPRWIRREDIWVLDVLARKGYRYDASINPVLRRFAGMPQFFAVGEHQLAGGRLWEVPVSTASWFGQRVAIGGGNWMRQLPHALLSGAVRKWDRSRREPLVFYFTSWELDLEQPQITAVSALSRMRQYRNLARTRQSLERYLQLYRFGSIAQHLGLTLTPTEPVAVRKPVAPVSEIQSTVPRTQLAVVVPIYNEEENIPYLLRTMQTVQQRLADRYDLQFVLVDDRSKDSSWEVMQRSAIGRNDVQLVRHDHNRGVAAAIMTGIRAAKADIVASIDCDCSYDPMELERMVPMLADADVVTASPYHPDGQVLNVPHWRLFLSRGLSWIYRRILGTDLHTWTSCFRIYRRDKVVDIELQNGGFLGVAEVLIRMLRRGARVREYPTLLEARLLGVSKMKTLRTVRGHLGLLWQVLRRKVS
ncbi:MAG TPA: glycosyltransferase [Planctomycetota bacterium]|nr:glycosyltransferase [Planctomycetota bacterium]